MHFPVFCDKDSDTLKTLIKLKIIFQDTNLSEVIFVKLLKIIATGD